MKCTSFINSAGNGSSGQGGRRMYGGKTLLVIR